MNFLASTTEILIGNVDPWLKLFRVAWAIFLTFDVALVVALIWVIQKGFAFRPPIHPSHTLPRRTLTLRDALMQERWRAVLAKAASGSADAFRIAIIDADKLADDALKQLGLEGEHMADRLEKITPAELRSLERLRRAHRIRNDFVHTPGFELSREAAARALEDYQAFLKEVQVL